MGVGIERDPVRPQLAICATVRAKLVGVWSGKPIDEIGVDRREAEPSRALDQGPNALERLNPVHRLLDLRVEILDPEADPVEADAAQVREPLGSDRARIDLDRNLGVGRNPKGSTQRIEDPGQLGIAQKGGRAAAEMQLGQRRSGCQRADHPADLGLQGIKILRGAVVVLGDDFVASAVVANRFAERDMHIDRERIARIRIRTGSQTGGACGAAPRQHAQQLLGAEIGGKTVRGGVRGIARARGVELLEQCLRQQGTGRLGWSACSDGRWVRERIVPMRHRSRLDVAQRKAHRSAATRGGGRRARV